MPCTIDINNIKTEDRQETILFETYDFIVYQNRRKLSLASCDGTLLSEVKLNVDPSKKNILDIGDALCFLFDSQEFVLLDKAGMQPVSYLLDVYRIGKTITPLFHSSLPNCVVFGTKLMNRVQLVNYNFMDQSRVIQTASWNVQRITDITYQKNNFYFVLDNSIITLCDMSTGETKWSKFEAAIIRGKLAIHKNNVYYIAGGLVKKTDGQKIEVIRVPHVRPSEIQYSSGNFLYFTGNDNKNLCRYNIATERLDWEIIGKSPITDSLQISVEKEHKIIECLVVRTENDNVSFIDLHQGKLLSSLRVKRFGKMIATNDHLIMYKKNGMTTLIPGVRQS